MRQYPKHIKMHKDHLERAKKRKLTFKGKTFLACFADYRNFQEAFHSVYFPYLYQYTWLLLHTDLEI